MKSNMKTYKAFRQFIGKGVEVEGGKNTDELYELEDKMNRAIRNVVEWRSKNMSEGYYNEALPQTILAILEGYDHHASEVASRCFLEVPSRDYGKGIEKEVNNR